MKTLPRFIAAGTIVALGAGSGWAQEASPPPAAETEVETREYGAPSGRTMDQEMERAQTRETAQRQQQSANEGESFRVSALMGSRVQNNRGERLGNVSDLAIDLETGEVAYVIVSAGGLVGGFGGELRPVPPDRFQVRALDNLLDGVELVMDIEMERWDRAPSIRLSEIAKLDSEKMSGDIREFYGQAGGSSREFGAREEVSSSEAELEEAELEMVEEPIDLEEDPMVYGAPDRELEAPEVEQPEYRQQQPQSSARIQETERMEERTQLSQPESREPETQARVQAQQAPEEQSRFSLASDLIGTSVRNEQHESVGEIEDVLVNLREGRVSYVTIEPARESFWQMPMENYAIGADSLERLNQNELVLSLSPEQLEDAEVVTEKELQTAQSGSGEVLRVEVEPGRPSVYGGRDHAPEQR